MSCIYEIKNEINNKRYIGSSTDPTRRFKDHIRALNDNKHCNMYLQNSYNKYGSKYFKINIIKVCNNITHEELLKEEQNIINTYKFKDLYNINSVVYSGGYEAVKIPSYILNLKGDIHYICESISEVSLILRGKTNVINTKYINKPSNHRSIYNNKYYRVVTVDFYNDNIDIIKTWKPYTCKTTYKYNFVPKIIAYNDITTKTFDSRRSCGEYIGVSVERVRQLITSQLLHKKSGMYIKEIIQDNNEY